MSITFNDRVAIVTGAGGGLGKCHALDLARRGAKVVVNDLGGNVDGSDNGSLSAAEMVVEEIKAAGGEAMANGEVNEEWWTAVFLGVMLVGDDVSVPEPKCISVLVVSGTRDRETSPTKEYFSKNCVSDILRRSLSV